MLLPYSVQIQAVNLHAVYNHLPRPIKVLVTYQAFDTRHLYLLLDILPARRVRSQILICQPDVILAITPTVGRCCGG